MNPSDRLIDWLKHECGFVSPTLLPLRTDAGWRRYFRVKEGDRCLVAMDASMERNSCVPFVAVGDALRGAGLCTPRVYHHDFSEGFLLIDDFGDQRLLEVLTADNVDHWYQHALADLLKIQHCKTARLPPFTAGIMREELQRFEEWFLTRWLQLSLSAGTRKLLAKAFDFVVERVACQPGVFMHRDYHSANLMVLGQEQLGILDFQDAWCGPVTYDLVSLLRDCYIAWPQEKVRGWVLAWHAEAFPPGVVSEETFMEWFDLMGVQRHLKALLTFSRKSCRDNDHRYLQHVPRTLQYVKAILPAWPALQGLHEFLLSVTEDLCEA